MIARAFGLALAVALDPVFIGLRRIRAVGADDEIIKILQCIDTTEMTEKYEANPLLEELDFAPMFYLVRPHSTKKDFFGLYHWDVLAKKQYEAWRDNKPTTREDLLPHDQV